MLNVVSIMGRLVADPQLRQTTTGKSVASFRIACDRGRKDANGQSQADFFDCVAWQAGAEFLCRYFRKGSLVALDGRLQSRNYQDKNGNNRTAIEIVAANLHFTGERTGAAASKVDEGGYAGGEPAAKPSFTQAGDDYALIEDEGDLPF